METFMPNIFFDRIRKNSRAIIGVAKFEDGSKQNVILELRDKEMFLKFGDVIVYTRDMPSYCDRYITFNFNSHVEITPTIDSPCPYTWNNKVEYNGYCIEKIFRAYEHMEESEKKEKETIKIDPPSYNETLSEGIER